MPVIDVERFAQHLRTSAYHHSQGQCAKSVRQALQAAGGVFVSGHPYHAKDYGNALRLMGFREMRVDRPDVALFIKGDIVVLQPYPGGNASGHIAGFDGVAWISDFKQTDLWGGRGYRDQRSKYAFYRP